MRLFQANDNLKNPLDPWLAFVAGWLLGRRSRHRSGLGCLLLGVGLIFGCSGVMTLVGVPLSWLSAHDISALPQPQPAELAALPAGTRLLITAQLPPNLPVDGSGLAVFYVERLATTSLSMPNSQATTTTPEWQTIRPAPSRIGMALADRSALLVQIGPATRFLNAQQVALDGKDLATTQQRAVGYQAGQVLTLQGAWEGNHLLTATTLYAGTPADYLADLRQMQGLGLVFGFVCGGLGFFLVAVGALLRFVGK